MIKITVNRRTSQLMKEVISQWLSFKKVLVAKERIIKLDQSTIDFFKRQLQTWYPKEGHPFTCRMINEKGETILSFVPGLVYDTVMNGTKWEGRAPTIVKIAETGYAYLHAFPEIKLRPFPNEKFALVIRALNDDEYTIPLIEKQA